MSDDSTTQCLLLPEIFGKPVVLQFDQVNGSSDGGAILLKAADRRYGLIQALVGCLRDKRQAGKVDHSLRELLSQRVFSIACGYPDANDSARLSADPIHKMLLNRDPITGRELASQPTLSRFENSIRPRELYRLGETLADSVDAGELEPLPTLDSLQWLHHRIADSGIQMEPRKHPAIHSSLHGIPGTAIRRCLQIHDRRTDCVFEPVPQRNAGGILQHLANHPTRIRPIDRGNNWLQAKIDIDRGTCSLETKLQGIAALQCPGCRLNPKQPRQEPVKRDLPPKTVDVHLLRLRNPLKSLLERPSECASGHVCSRCIHQATRRRASANILRAGPLSCALRIC